MVGALTEKKLLQLSGRFSLSGLQNNLNGAIQFLFVQIFEKIHDERGKDM